MSSLPPPAAPLPPSDALPPLPAGVAVASKGQRFGALLLDALLSIVTCGIGWIIWQLVILPKATSPGKSLLKMKAVYADSGRPLSTGDTAMRELLWKLVIGNITGGISSIVGGVMVLASDPPKAWWDSVSKSVVVVDPDGVLGV